MFTEAFGAESGHLLRGRRHAPAHRQPSASRRILLQRYNKFLFISRFGALNNHIRQRLCRPCVWPQRNRLTSSHLHACRKTHCKRSSFRRRKATFCTLKGRLLQCKRRPLKKAPTSFIYSTGSSSSSTVAPSFHMSPVNSAPMSLPAMPSHTPL